MTIGFEEKLTTEVVDLVDQTLQVKVLEHVGNDAVKYNEMMVLIYLKAANRHIDSRERHERAQKQCRSVDN